MSYPVVSVVVPAHNEVLSIEEVVRDIERCVIGVVHDAEMIVVDDASTDGTLSLLAMLALDRPWLRVLALPANVGHGPAVAAGLRLARGEWIFQLDADRQFVVDDFAALWARRLDADLALGVRVRRHDAAHRLVLSKVTALFASALAGRRLVDVNTPFRLFRRSLWTDVSAVVGLMPAVPSVSTCVAASRWMLPIEEIAVTHLARAHGRSSLNLRRLAPLVARAAVEVTHVARVTREPVVLEAINRIVYGLLRPE